VRMSESDLKKALDHDVAQKGANAKGAQVVEISTERLLESLEVKQACVAKAVSVAYLDVAQKCAVLLLQELSPSVEVRDGKSTEKPPRADAKRIKDFLGSAQGALKVAREADYVGDSAAMRVKTPEPVGE
jgi:hypothetical protein